eukprot:gene12789-14100_t
MSDKRRAARVQGAWAATKRTRQAPSSQQQIKSHATSSNPQAPSTADHAACSSRNNPPAFTFKPTVTKSIEAIPQENVISSDGEYDISIGPNGVSKLQLLRDFIKPEEAEWMFEQLQAEIPWQEKEITMFGKKMMQPRLIAWFGDFPYTYSRITLKPFKWSPLLDILRQKIQAETGLTFNTMLANLYRNNKDSVDWHSDDEKSLGDNPTIASLSFGDTRMFEMRIKPAQKGEINPVSGKVKVPLSSGSLLIMEGATQHDWQSMMQRMQYHRHRSKDCLSSWKQTWKPEDHITKYRRLEGWDIIRPIVCKWLQLYLIAVGVWRMEHVMLFAGCSRQEFQDMFSYGERGTNRGWTIYSFHSRPIQGDNGQRKLAHNSDVVVFIFSQTLQMFAKKVITITSRMPNLSNNCQNDTIIATAVILFTICQSSTLIDAHSQNTSPVSDLCDDKEK